MYHSYVLGADDSIYSLCEHGFIIEKESITKCEFILNNKYYEFSREGVK